MKKPKREAVLRAHELTRPVRLFYVSFAEPKPVGWLGAAIVRAHGTVTAIDRCNMLGINPGGGIVVVPFPGPVLSELTDRLLNREEMERAFGELEKIPDNKGIRICGHCNKVHGPGVH